MEEQAVAAEPLYRLIGRIRQPVALRDLIALCMRSIYTGDPLTREENVIPQPPKHLVEQVSVSEEIVAGIRCVVYSPELPGSTELPERQERKLPCILYMHGGGFVIGCSEDTDYTARMLCHTNQAVVVSVNYRLAPETIFPGALTDCEMALDWVIGCSARLGIDPTRLYLAGDSAGANLAAALGKWLSGKGAAISAIKGLILLAPWLDMAVESYPSYNRLAPTGIVFDSPFLAYARAAYVGVEEWKNPLVSPLLWEVAEMPPTIALIGTEDPFIDQVLELKQKALSAGCQHIETAIYEGMPHCFYSFPDLFVEEEDCYRQISQFIARTSY